MIDPFEKSIRDLEIKDLQKLIEMNFCESMYIEYKSDMPDKKKIAKAMAGFANSHGGYLIIGVDRDCGRDEVPKSFPGTSMTQKPKDEIKNICRDHISPMPIYQAKYLEVNKSKGILVIQIEESLDTPHINRDGKIYRRQSNSTESIPEDARETIDELYRKGLSGKEAINKYLEKKEDHFESNRHIDKFNVFFIEIIICPIPMRQLIKDLFDDHSTYGNLLPLFNRSHDMCLDIDCIYQQNGFNYRELDNYGCLSLHHGEETRLGKNWYPELEIYSERPLIDPRSIEYFLKECIVSAQKIYKVCSEKGFDHFGKIRLKISLRNVRSKCLFYKDHLRHYKFTDAGCRHRILEIPPYDCDISNLENPAKIIEKTFKHLNHGFNLPF